MFVALGKEFDMDCYINIKTGNPETTVQTTIGAFEGNWLA